MVSAIAQNEHDDFARKLYRHDEWLFDVSYGIGVVCLLFSSSLSTNYFVIDINLMQKKCKKVRTNISTFSIANYLCWCKIFLSVIVFSVSIYDRKFYLQKEDEKDVNKKEILNFQKLQ